MLSFTRVALAVLAVLGAGRAYAGTCVSRKCFDEPAIESVRSLVAAACDCNGAARHKQYVKCAKAVIEAAIKQGTLPAQCEKTVRRCEAQSTCGIKNAAVCCSVTGAKLQARRMRGNRCGGKQCKGAFALVDACTPQGECAPRSKAGGRSFRAIQKVFTTSCASASCHSVSGRQGGLVLDEEDLSYVSLVDKPAGLAAAKELGLKRVVPGDPDNSFLIQKLRGTGPGDRMPQGIQALPDPVIKLVGDWIARGAKTWKEECEKPTTAEAQELCNEDAPYLGGLVFHPEPPLPVPERGKGVQIYTPPLAIPQGWETEQCFVVKPDWGLPPGETPVIQEQVFSAHPGTHHVSIFAYLGDHPERWPLGQFFSCAGLEGFRPKDDPVVAFDGSILIGGGSFQKYTLTLPPGVGMAIPPNALIIVDVHYTNPFPPDQHVWGESWTNLIYSEPGTLKVTLDGVVDFNRSDLVVEPYTTKTMSDIWRPSSVLGGPLIDVAIHQLYSHMHKRGIWYQIDFVKGGACSVDARPCGRDGDCRCQASRPTCVKGQTCILGPDHEDTPIHYTTSWDGAPILNFPPPFFRVKANEGLRYSCTVTNGVRDDPARPPKQCHENCLVCGWDPVSRTCIFRRGFDVGLDAAPRVFQLGEAMPVAFDVLADDEMCALFGYFIKASDLPKLGIE